MTSTAIWGETEPEQQRAERSDLHTGEGSADGMPARMPAGRSPVAGRISGREGGGAGRGTRRERSGPREHATAKPGCLKRACRLDDQKGAQEGMARGIL